MKRVLVVDDDELALSLTKIALDMEGYSSVVAKNGMEAIEKLSLSPKPDVILMDLLMPVMGGLEFREKQLANPDLSDIPVVFLSADFNCHDIVRSTKAHACIKKPVALDELLATVAEITR